MRITVETVERQRDYASKQTNLVAVTCGSSNLSSDIEKAIRKAAVEYRLSLADVVALCLAYYFGDGANHLGCDSCEWHGREGCEIPRRGEQTTVPLLDKGTVVIG